MLDHMLKIYFAGSIRGGREDRQKYLKIIKHLQKYGRVLTEHVGSSDISQKGENYLSEQYIYQRDIKWLIASDVIVAEVSNPSLGVGYEIAYAENVGKKIFCLYNKNSKKKLSAMISGNSDIKIEKYSQLSEGLKAVDGFFEKEFKIKIDKK